MYEIIYFLYHNCSIMKYLIVGLGNIGEQYNDHRHNIGFTVLDHFAHMLSINFEINRLGFVGYSKYKGRSLHLLKPTTFMNNSGKAVHYWLRKQKINTHQLLVVTDDIALPFGKLRIKGKGSCGGHNGLKSIGEHLLTYQFSRLKFGIGNNFGPGKQAQYVLGNFSNDEKSALPSHIHTACSMIFSFCCMGILHTMNVYN